MATLNESPTVGLVGHIADHAELKAGYDARGATQGALPVYTSTSTLAEHATVHNRLHAEHNALGAATTLPTGLGAFSGADHALWHAALHKAHNLRSVPTTVQPVGTPGTLKTWTVAFQDEFEGTTLSDKWAPSWFNGGTMNNVSTSAANVSVAGGSVNLKLGSDTVGALINTNPSDGGNPKYGQSGAGFLFNYGYAEARIWFPGEGTMLYNFPAWWTNGGQSGYTDGEHDIAEGLYQMASNYHYGDPHVANNQTIPGTWTNAWHTYGMHRQPGKADIYFDGQLVRTYTTYDGGAPHYLILNVGKRTSTPNDNNRVGDAGTMKVDYVRVWAP